MSKITHNFYRVKRRVIVGRLLSFFVLLLISTQMSWGQQVIGAFPATDGGFEGQSTIATVAAYNSTTFVSTLSSSLWTKDSSGITSAVLSDAGSRSGNKYVSIVSASTGGTGKYLQSPELLPTLSVNAQYTVQYFYKSSASGTVKAALTTTTRGSNAGISDTFVANQWVKSYWVTSSGATTNGTEWAGIGSVLASSTTYIDDFVIYPGVFDAIAPDAPTAPVVAIASATTLNVGWTAPGTGVDGGGYVVVRYAANPNADNDPNQNGIYKVGNTTTNGAGSLTGTVVFVGTSASTSFVDTVADSSVSYYYKIYTVDKAFNYSNEIIAGPVVASTTWNGSTWSNGTPDSTFEAIIDGTYSGAAFNAKKLTINSGKSLTITSGNLTIQNEVINNGTMVIENNANLVQVLGTTNTNTGNIVVKRNSSPLLRLDYTLWSSPVAGQKLTDFSPLTSQSPSRFYTYDTANNQYSNAFDPTTTNFAAGTGYSIRMPNTADAVTPTAYAGQFTGVPNNGDVPFVLSTAGGGYNLVGNPYPSPITMATLVANNSTVISTTMYFWRKTNGVGTAYCTYNTAGSLFVTNGNAQSVDPAGVIQTGQGFFVQAIAPGSLVFKNGQRVANTAGQFFRTKQVATSDKIWLNATNTAGDFSQMAVNYTEGATQSVDAFDGKYINDSPLALTSNINNDEYTIQGRPAFDASDVVPLNFKTAVAGDYTIAIDHSEGVFAAGQSVILTDATTGIETDLTTSSYTFTATTGTASSRFSLKYQKTLGTNKAVFSDNNVVVYRSKGTLYINAGDATIANIKVYDMQGRLVAELKNVKATSATIANLKATNQVLVVKITSQDNKVVTKKVVN